LSLFKSENAKGEWTTVRLLHWQNIVRLATLHNKSGYWHPPVRTDMDLREEKVAVAINALERRAERQDNDLTLYHVFTIDYGCYAELKGTRAEPNQDVFLFPELVTVKQDSQDIVPLPDRRSIRRIIVSRDQIEKFYTR
jgi:hypothetical protein